MPVESTLGIVNVNNGDSEMVPSDSPARCTPSMAKGLLCIPGDHLALLVVHWMTLNTGFFHLLCRTHSVVLEEFDEGGQSEVGHKDGKSVAECQAHVPEPRVVLRGVPPVKKASGEIYYPIRVQVPRLTVLAERVVLV
jgi:hypothetical protein